MPIGLVGRKCGMTRIFTDSGDSVPVTVIEALPNRVTTLKTPERDGYRAVHNVNYWEYGDYLGIGPGAHSKLSFPDRVIRQARLRNPATWMAAAKARDNSHLATDQTVQAADFAIEFMLNALRLKEGVPARYFYERTGQPLSSITPALARARARGLLANDPLRLQATPLGWRFLSDLQAEFFE